MTESSTYQALIARGLEQGIEQGTEQGLERGVRTTILRQGTKRFGPLPAPLAAVLDNIHSVERLETISDRLLEVESWDELMADDAL